jgi:hypothetical protein
MMEKQMTAAQAGYLADLIAKRDIRFDPQMVTAQGAAKCEAVRSLILAKAQAMVDAGLSVEQASALIEALESQSWRLAGKAVAITKSELSAIQSAK